MKNLFRILFAMKFDTPVYECKFNEKFIFKATIPLSSITCDPSAVLILPPDAKQWLCNKLFTSTVAVKNTKCFLTCNNEFEIVQG